MNKKILLAVGITILFLGLAIQPSVATVPPKKIDVEPDIEGLVTQLRVVINEILQDYSHIPIIRTLGNKIINILSLLGSIIICISLILLVSSLVIIFIIMGILGLKDNDIYSALSIMILGLAISTMVFCSGYFIQFKTLSNINRLYASDSPTLTGLDECPCMQD